MIKYKAILKEPGKKPEFVYFSNSLKFLDGKLDGPPSTIKITTRAEKKISLFYSSDSVIKGKEYNFTLQIVPDNKKYWLDFCGPVIIFGRDAEDNLLDCPLTMEETGEIFTEPYEY